MNQSVFRSVAVELFSLPKLRQHWGSSEKWQLFQEKQRKIQSQNTFVPGMTEEYITQVSVEIEGRVTKQLSQELIRTESNILGALSKIDELLLNLQVPNCSKTFPGTSRNNDIESREPSRDHWQSDVYHEVESLLVRQAFQLTQITRSPLI